jgi:hypothetical protein
MYLSSLIREAYESNGVVIAYVYGHMGYGKTSYALWTAYEVLGDWRRVLRYVFFDLGDAIDVMWRHVRRGERIPIMILDDAGFFLNRLTWWERDKVEFMELLNLARSMAAGIVFTSPTHEIPRQILSKTNYRVAVRPLEPEEVAKSEAATEVSRVARRLGLADYVAVARGYQLVVLPSFSKRVRKEFIDYYPLHYPVFEEYTRIRMAQIRSKLRELREREAAVRKQLLDRALQIYIKEGDPRRVYEFLVGKLPRSTAYRWAFQRIPKLAGGSPSGSKL